MKKNKYDPAYPDVEVFVYNSDGKKVRDYFQSDQIAGFEILSNGVLKMDFVDGTSRTLSSAWLWVLNEADYDKQG